MYLFFVPQIRIYFFVESLLKQSHFQILNFSHGYNDKKKIGCYKNFHNTNFIVMLYVFHNQVYVT